MERRAGRQGRGSLDRLRMWEGSKGCVLVWRCGSRDSDLEGQILRRRRVRIWHGGQGRRAVAAASGSVVG